MNLSHKHSKFLKLEQDSNGNYIISFRFREDLPYGEPIECFRYSKEETKRKRKLYKNTYYSKENGTGVPTHRFMGYLAALNEKAHKEGKKGPLDGKLTPKQIADAKRNIIPEGFDIHHIQPISIQGKNSFDNLVLVSEEVHTALHIYMNVVLAYLPYVNQKRLPNQPKIFIRLPQPDKCISHISEIIPQKKTIINQPQTTPTFRKNDRARD